MREALPRICFLLGAAFFGLFVGASDIAAQVRVQLSGAATNWFESLDEKQRNKVLYEFEDEERFDLRLAPIFLEGLDRGQMSESQWQGWRTVLAEALSAKGLAKVEGVMSLERELSLPEQQDFVDRLLAPFSGDPEDGYHVALFGHPGAGLPWGFRFEGHHVSLNWTVMPDGTVSTAPVFLGSQPREVGERLERAGLRVLGDEEDAGHALWQALDKSQRAQGELPFAFGSGMFGQNRALFLGEASDRLELGAPAGVAYAEMTSGQRERFDALLGVYLERLSQPLHDARAAGLDAAGRDALHFAWSGSLQPGEPGYYRIQGPTLLVEFDNTLEAADHVHTIVRDLDGDFGRDLLAEHHARHHPAGSQPMKNAFSLLPSRSRK